jgi:hypothetical protein
MNIATYQLIVPNTIGEIERRAARALHDLPTRPAGWSPARWLRARWAAIGTDGPAHPAATTAAMIATDALTRGGIATGMPRID